ncbi:MAG TPA: biopolymer transporter ExbD [Opitutaceae bacterium]|nr:biopolymer transporter ExbD [Opitutaceae bacterium]
MARTFRRQRQAQPIAELNLTNLIDLGFTLLIIFMIATPLINQEQTMAVNLPVTSAGPTEKPDSSTKFQAVSIDRQGQYFWGETRVTMVELRSHLSAAAALTKPPVIRIRADGGVDYQKVMTLMDELKKRGLSKITFDSQTNR